MFIHVALLFATLLGSARAEPTIFLVRHAEKESGDAKDPDLSAAGRDRAESLAAMLKDAGITAIFATEYERTQQTAAPLARALHLDLTVIPAKETDALISKLKETKRNALVVGHSNTLPAIIKALGVATAVEIGEANYDDLFSMKLNETPVVLVHRHY